MILRPRFTREQRRQLDEIRFELAARTITEAQATQLVRQVEAGGTPYRLEPMPFHELDAIRKVQRFHPEPEGQGSHRGRRPSA